jgi:hemerythrin-like metal-binding protein
MTHIPWKERYSIHYKDIDAQHQGLLALLNQLGDLAGAGARPEQFSDIYRSLSRYAIQHFRNEEHYLQACGYEGLHRHQSEHAKFIEWLLELNNSFDLADPELPGTTSAFLKDWLIQHIMKADQAYAACVKSFHGRAAIRGIIFGFDRVIADFDYQPAIGRLSAMCGLPPELLEPLFKPGAPLLGKYARGEIGSAMFLSEVSRLCGHVFTKEEFIPVFSGIFTPVQATCDLIRQLKPRYKLGLIADTNPWHFEHAIRTSEVFPLFDAMSVSCLVQALRPDPRLFQEILEQLDLMAEECVLIDHDPAFVQASGDALLHGIHYRDHRDLLAQLRALKVSWLGEYMPRPGPPGSGP